MADLEGMVLGPFAELGARSSRGTLQVDLGCQAELRRHGRTQGKEYPKDRLSSLYPKLSTTDSIPNPSIIHAATILSLLITCGVPSVVIP